MRFKHKHPPAAVGVQPIALSPGGHVRLNPLTPRGGPERQLNLLYSVGAAALERHLGQIIVGRSREPWWRQALGRSVAARMIRDAEGFDVLVASLEPEARA